MPPTASPSSPKARSLRPRTSSGRRAISFMPAPMPSAGAVTQRARAGRRPGAAYTPSGYVSLPCVTLFIAWTYTASKDQLLGRLARIEGQVRGVARMVDEERYCIDVLTQISAVAGGAGQGRARAAGRPRATLRARRRPGERVELTDELMGAVGRLMRRGWDDGSRRAHPPPRASDAHVGPGARRGGHQRDAPLPHRLRDRRGAGMVIGTRARLLGLGTIALAVILAFLFGYTLTSLPLLRAGLALCGRVRSRSRRTRSASRRWRSWTT